MRCIPYGSDERESRTDDVLTDTEQRSEHHDTGVVGSNGTESKYDAPNEHYSS